MAPPTPLLDAAEVRLAQMLAVTSDCPLKSLQQYECAIYGTEIICVPFLRMFRACGKNAKRNNNSQIKSTGNKRLIEVTDEFTNKPIKRTEKETVKSQLEIKGLDEFREMVKESVKK